MAKILVLEDEPAMLVGLRDNLEFEGYEVETADRGDTGLQKILGFEFDLVVLDLMLPGLSGFDVLKQMRKKGNVTPVIMLTARGEEMDKVLGLELGADDYITKPFSLRELLARIKAVLRRSQTLVVNHDNDMVTIGKLSVSFRQYEAFSEGEPVRMSHKEFEILAYLYKNAGHIVSRDSVLDHVWGDGYQPVARTVDNFILHLRQKIDTENSNHIMTVHGVGYKLVL
jgi:DNA-binding response OmpR family regulator